ncbi:MAG: hypothetical protein J4N95_01590 [Chloroflexi bacterium]|nr:hypothetical protein [Chloroflexota bacterium]MCI0855138.1 hypothetical protein [Chloroflexota bacterium]MCI0889877.1 hypothetical protein [Chloroflexota bacterium]
MPRAPNSASSMFCWAHPAPVCGFVTGLVEGVLPCVTGLVEGVLPWWWGGVPGASPAERG